MQIMSIMKEIVIVATNKEKDKYECDDKRLLKNNNNILENN